MKQAYNKKTFEERATEIRKLNSRIKETLKTRSQSQILYQKWEKACAEFHGKYRELAFYNGIEDYRKEIRSGNREAIEYYISFIENRPYFFRSGYMYQDLMRVLKNCNLTPNQRKRYEQVKIKLDKIKKERNSNKIG